MNKIGIMQGRLSPRPENEKRLQFFPVDWRREFEAARAIGFDCIEWLLDWEEFKKNPLLSEHGAKEIRSAARASGVETLSLCSDYFMKYPLAAGDPVAAAREVSVQMRAAAACGQNLILIPLLEDHAVTGEAEKQRIISVVARAREGVPDTRVRIAFETELPADELIDFVDRFRNPRVGVYYDIGNCTSYGFDCPRDLTKLSKRVFGVHIKDRKAGSAQSVMLGAGDADFEKCFAVLSDVGYTGTYILQAWRGDDYRDDAATQLKFVREIMEKL